MLSPACHVSGRAYKYKECPVCEAIPTSIVKNVFQMKN